MPRSSARPRAPAADGESLGLLIHVVAKAWREELDRRLRPLGLTRVQWQALLLIARAQAGLTQRELAQALDIGAPATVALVDRMERDGLVERTPVPGDRRRNAVCATGSSRRLLGRIQATAGTLRREVLDGLSPAEVATLTMLLHKARQRIEALRT
jgi:MarR family transcriptional regulator for hemolysin